MIKQTEGGRCEIKLTVCIPVSSFKRERERERETDRQTDRQKQRQRERHTHTQRQTDKQTDQQANERELFIYDILIPGQRKIFCS